MIGGLLEISSEEQSSQSSLYSKQFGEPSWLLGATVTSKGRSLRVDKNQCPGLSGRVGLLHRGIDEWKMAEIHQDSADCPVLVTSRTCHLRVAQGHSPSTQVAASNLLMSHQEDTMI